MIDITASAVGSADTDAMINRPMQRLNHAILGWGMVIFGFFGFLMWASLAPLDRGVVVAGSVTVSGYRKAVQHQSGGVIQTIHVSDGDYVQAGQTLFTLDQSILQAQAITAESQYWMNKIKESRLTAEQSPYKENDELTFPIALNPSADRHPMVTAYLSEAKQLQQTLFSTRRNALATELKVLNEQQSGAKSRLKNLLSIQEIQLRRSKLMAQRISGMELLAQDDFIPKNRLLDVQEAQALLMVDIQRGYDEIEAVKHRINELTFNIQQVKTNYQKNVNSELSDVKDALKKHHQNMIEAQIALTNSEIKSPVSGTVVNLSMHSVGGVIRPAETLLEVLPTDQPLIIDAKFPLESIDSLSLKQSVDIMFTAFNRSQTPKVKGNVDYISADKLIDEATQMPYYGGRISVASESLSALENFKIVPGMPVQAFVQNGERTLLSYLFKPFVDRMPLALAGDE